MIMGDRYPSLSKMILVFWSICPLNLIGEQVLDSDSDSDSESNITAATYWFCDQECDIQFSNSYFCNSKEDI